MGNHSSKSDDSQPHICPVQSLDEDATQNLFANTSFYEFNKILSGSCAAFTLLAMLVFMLLHATHFSKPNEQFKILKISVVVPFYAIFNFLSVVFPAAQVYLLPWLDFIQAIALGSFFLLLCEFVSPSEIQRDVFFSAMTVPDKKSGTGTRDGLVWFRTRWFLIFQYPIVSLFVAILTDITQAAGVYCQFETKLYWAKLWLNIISKASLVFAVISVLRFYSQLKSHLAHHGPLAKLVAFKLIVTLTFLQSIIFLILQSTGALNPTPTMTYADLHIGIPGLVICIETVFFALFFFYAYSWSPYLLRNQRNYYETRSGQQVPLALSYQGGPLGVYALLGMWNPSETIQAIVFGIKLGMELHQGRNTGSNVSSNHQEYYLLGPHGQPVDGDQVNEPTQQRQKYQQEYQQGGY